MILAQMVLRMDILQPLSEFKQFNAEHKLWRGVDLH